MKGNKYKSGFERTTAECLIRMGIEFEYENLTLPYVVEKNYNPDFQLDNGVIIETKGKWDADDRRKHLIIRDKYPEHDIRLLFMRDNPIRKGSKVKYSNWCDKHGILYAVGEVPVSWTRPRAHKRYKRGRRNRKS